MRAAATKTKQLALSARLPAGPAQVFEVVAQGSSMDECRASCIDGRQTRLEPAAHRVFVYAQAPRNFLDRVGAVNLDAASVDTPHLAASPSIKARISSTRHAVIRGPSFTGLGYRPLLTPAHHVDFETGMGPFGARIEASLRNPVCERSTDMHTLQSLRVWTVLRRGVGGVAEFRNSVGEFLESSGLRQLNLEVAMGTAEVGENCVLVD